MHLADMIFRNEQMCPERPSFEFNSQSYTWRDTANRVRRLAAAALGVGLERNDAVAVLSLNNAVYCECYFGLNARRPRTS